MGFWGFGVLFGFGPFAPAFLFCKAFVGERGVCGLVFVVFVAGVLLTMMVVWHVWIDLGGLYVFAVLVNAVCAIVLAVSEYVCCARLDCLR